MKTETTPFFYKKLQSGFYIGCWLINAVKASEAEYKKLLGERVNVESR